MEIKYDPIMEIKFGNQIWKSNLGELFQVKPVLIFLTLHSCGKQIKRGFDEEFREKLKWLIFTLGDREQRWGKSRTWGACKNHQNL